MLIMVLTRLWNQLDATGGCSWFGIRMESANVPTGVEMPAERQQLDIIFSFFSASPSCRQALLTFLGTNHSPFIKKWVTYAYIIFFSFCISIRLTRRGGLSALHTNELPADHKALCEPSGGAAKVSWHLPLIWEHLPGSVRSMLELRTLRSVQTPTA